MPKEVRKYKTSEIRDMFEVCNVRHDCEKSCRGCVYNDKGHKTCKDMLFQFNNMSRAEQLSTIISSRILKDNF